MISSRSFWPAALAGGAPQAASGELSAEPRFSLATSRYPPLRGVLVLTLATLLGLAAGLLLVRRWSGALDRPLEATGLLCVALVAAGSAAAIRLLGSRQPSGLQSTPGGWALAVDWSPAAALLAIAASLWLPGVSLGGFLGLVLIFAVEEALAGPWPRLLRSALLQGGARGLAGNHARDPTGAGPNDHFEPVESSTALAADTSVSPVQEDQEQQQEQQGEYICQQLARSRLPGGGEVVRGWSRADFLGGQRTAAVHVAFCPPLAGTPRLVFEQISGPPARIKAGQVLAYGARLDVKLTEAAEETTSVVVQFQAIAAGDGETGE